MQIVLAMVLLCMLLHGLVTADSSAGCPAGAESSCARADEVASPETGQALLQKALATASSLAAFEEEPTKPEAVLVQVEQHVAEQRDRARTRLGIEGDLRKVVSRVRAYQPEDDCATNARKSFDEALEASGLKAELTEEEQANFMTRFTEEMLADCKYDDDVAAHWVELVAAGLEHQKPVVTQALVDSINKADLGFKAEVRDFMKNESKVDFDALLGMDPELADPADNSSAELLQLEDMQLPETFDAGDKVPNCKENVWKIHNQGTCGSCWAFGTLSAVDSRLCIATNGAFSGPKAVLSRGYMTSCSTPGGRNGCQGGWFSFVYNLLGEGISCDRRGGGCKGHPGSVLGTDNGCVPYFGHGSGVDHFDSQSSAPPCQSQCVKPSQYFRPFKEDLYVMQGGASWARGAQEFAGYTDTQAAQRARQAIYKDGPLPFAVMADGSFKSYSSGVMRGGCKKSPNHCVTAVGFGKDYFDSLNSWGPRWGDKGGFKIGDCLVTHWSIPPPMPKDASKLPTTPESKGPSPAPGPPAPGPPAPGPPAPPPGPPMKPVWAATAGPCSVDGAGCLVSTNYKSGGEDQDHDDCEGKTAKYGPNETCTFDLLAKPSPAIQVVDFKTEKKFDVFTVNGVGYSGSAEEVKALHGVIPTGQMQWKSDKGFEKSGWKLCPKDPRQGMTPTGCFKDKDGKPYAMYVKKVEEGEKHSWPGFQEAGSFKGKDGTVYKIYIQFGSCPSGPAPGPAPGPSPGPSPGPPAPGPPPPAPKPPPPQYDDPDAATWLQVHNYFRCIHNTEAIGWDKDVAAGAATWAQRGQMSHAKCYKIPAPRGPAGENLAAGQSDIMAAVTAWYDESPQRGPRCGGHCTALLWKKSTALGCSKKNTWNGNRPMYVCRYARSAANFGSKSEGVNMPDYSREPSCYEKYPVSKRWSGGGGGGRRGSGTLEGSEGANGTDDTDGQGPADTGDPADAEEPSGDEQQ